MWCFTAPFKKQRVLGHNTVTVFLNSFHCELFKSSAQSLCRLSLNLKPGVTLVSGFQVTIWEALTNSRPVPQSPLYEEDSQLERWAYPQALPIFFS